MTYTNNISKILALSALIASASLASASDDLKLDFYGKLHQSFTSIDVNINENASTEFDDHASRLGVKGSYDFTDTNVQVIFQLEHGVNLNDRISNSKIRNSYVGIKNKSWGQVLIGTHDTAFKKAQGKIDVFNDVIDIKEVAYGENRLNDVIHYVSPDMGGLKIALTMVVNDGSNEDVFGDQTSLAIQYQTGGLYLAAAFDSAIKGWDGTRLVASYSTGAHRFGIATDNYSNSTVATYDAQAVDGNGDPISGMYVETVASDAEPEAVFFSYSYKIPNSKSVLKFVTANSKLAEHRRNFTEDVEITYTAFGYDWSLSKKAKITSYVAQVERIGLAGTLVDAADRNSTEDRFGVGLQVKF